MPRFHLGPALAAAFLAAPLSAALADDRDPTPEELARIEAVLQAEGFVSYDDIEWDNGMWEIDDARTTDGKEYDVKLDQTFNLVERVED